MTTIELPTDVAQELLLAANSENKTVGDYIIFLMRGDIHPDRILPQGEYHPAEQTSDSTSGCNLRPLANP